MKKDLNIWQNLSRGIEAETIWQDYKNPSQFQRELAKFIAELLQGRSKVHSLECGSAFGITSALLPPRFKISLLDYDQNALQKAKQLYGQLRRKCKLICLDIFKIKTQKTGYDLVFNAGVLEHFTKSSRAKIVEKMVMLTKKGGYILIAVPNHYSLPYRLGYLWQRLVGQWRYPIEYKMNLTKELKNNLNLKFLKETALDKPKIYEFLPAKASNYFKKLDRLLNFEGYLKVYLFKRV